MLKMLLGNKISYSWGNKSCFIKQLKNSRDEFTVVSSIYGKNLGPISAEEHRKK